MTDLPPLPTPRQHRPPKDEDPASARATWRVAWRNVRSMAGSGDDGRGLGSPFEQALEELAWDAFRARGDALEVENPPTCEEVGHDWYTTMAFPGPAGFRHQHCARCRDTQILRNEECRAP